jgi:WD40 repeat protein
MLVLKGHRGRVRSLSFSADGGLLASAAGHGKAVSLWELTGRGKRSFLSGHPGDVTAVAFAPTGSFLASMDSWGQVQLWNTAERRKSAKLARPFQGVFGMAFTADGRTLAVGRRVVSFATLQYVVEHLDRNGKKLPDWKVPSGAYAGVFCGRSLACSPAGNALAVVGNGPDVHLWGLSPVRLRARLPQRESVNALAFSPDGRTLAVAAGLEVRLWGAATGAERATLKGHTRMVTSVAFTPDGRLLASAGTDGQVKLWDVAAAAERAAFDWQVGPVTALALAPDGMRGACGGLEGAVAVWDLDL